MHKEPMTLNALTAVQGRAVLNLSAVEAMLGQTQRTLSLLTMLDDVGALPESERIELDAFVRHTLKCSETLLRAFIDAEEEEHTADEERIDPGTDTDRKPRSPRPRTRQQGTTARRNRARVVSLVARTAQLTDANGGE